MGKRTTTIGGMEFSDLTDELFREYTFPTAHGPVTVTVPAPAALNVSASGGHRIVDREGFSHYIPSGWVALTFKVRAGESFFTF